MKRPRWKIIVVSRRISEGERLPPWYFKMSYIDWCHMGQATFHPIPFCYVIRVFMWMRDKWNRWRSKPTWLDKQTLAAYKAGVEMQQRRDKALEHSDKMVEEMFGKYLDGAWWHC